MRVSWRACEGVDAYRLAFTGPDGSLIGHSETLAEPTAELAVPGNGDGEVRAKLEACAEDGAWHPQGPPARLPVASAGAAATNLRWQPAAAVHRLTVYDRTEARTILDDPVLGASFPFECPEALCSHDLVMRTRAWVGGGWDEGTEWQPLPLEIVLGERRPDPPPIEPAAPDPFLLAFTVDTECSILRQHDPDPDRVVDELVFGDYGSGSQHGIGLHMDLLEHFGFRGCFFLDILMEHTVGREAVERIVEAILSRGHEIQLHLHPEHLHPGVPPPAEALEIAVELFSARVGRPPVAFRAGGYRILEDHFPLLERHGIAIDSSVHPYFNARAPEWMRTRTQPFLVGGVLEAPPTWIMIRDDGRPPEARAFAPNPAVGDPVTAIEPPPAGPPYLATYVSHSFQFLKAKRDKSPEGIARFGERLRAKLPDEEAERLLAALGDNMRVHDGELDHGSVAATAGILRRVADRPDARCVTYAELAEIAPHAWARAPAPPVDPVPVLDRRRGVATTVVSRTRTAALLAHLSGEDEQGEGDGAGAGAIELGDPRLLGERIRALAQGQPEGQPLRLEFATLGERAQPDCAPPLSHLLFAAHQDTPVAAWDASTFVAWLRGQDYEIVSERRHRRGADEIEKIERHRDSLLGLDPEELRVSRLELTVRSPTAAAPRSARRGSTWLAALAPEELGPAATNLYESAAPGEELELELARDAGPSSPTTVVLALMRAGFVVLAADSGTAGLGLRLVRPLSLDDVLALAGQG